MGFQHPLDQRAAPKASTFDNPEMTVLGSCKRIEEIMIGPETAGGFPWAAHHGSFSHCVVRRFPKGLSWWLLLPAMDALRWKIPELGVAPGHPKKFRL